MSERSFQNTFEDYTLKNNSIINDAQFKSKLNTYIDETLNIVYTKNESNKDSSIYTGTSGIALLLYLKFKKSKDKKALLDAQKLLQKIKYSKHRISFICGDPGPLALSAVIEHELGNNEESKKFIKILLEMYPKIANPKADECNEMLYGRAGFLYALLFLNANISKSTIEPSIIKQIITTILDVGRSEAKHLRLNVPLIYTWHDKQYFGAAHGLSGILYMLLIAADFVDEKQLASLIKPSIDYLMGLRFQSGNFPSSLGSDRDRHVQWCHGAPGFIQLLCSSYKIFNDKKYLDAALQCGEIVWQKGILTKGYSICHGVAGNAYTFLSLFQLTQDEKHLYRAYKFADWCLNYSAQKEYHYPDRPYSLFEGLAGRVYFLIDIQDPMNAKFPAYDI